VHYRVLCVLFTAQSRGGASILVAGQTPGVKRSNVHKEYKVFGMAVVPRCEIFQIEGDQAGNSHGGDVPDSNLILLLIVGVNPFQGHDGR
jgi:hypothetical protein